MGVLTLIQLCLRKSPPFGVCLLLCNYVLGNFTLIHLYSKVFTLIHPCIRAVYPTFTAYFISSTSRREHLIAEKYLFGQKWGLIGPSETDSSRQPLVCLHSRQPSRSLSRVFGPSEVLASWSPAEMAFPRCYVQTRMSGRCTLKWFIVSLMYSSELWVCLSMRMIVKSETNPCK